MATKKKATKKKATKRKTTTRKSTKRTKKAAATDDATDATAPDVEAAAEKPESKSRKKTTAKKTRKKSTRKSTKASARTSGNTTRRAKAETGPTEEVGQDGSIVIRFPPVAPSPFGGTKNAEPAVARSSEESATATAVVDEAPPAEDSTADVVDEPAPPKVRAPRPTREPSDRPSKKKGDDRKRDDESEKDESGLSRSQKRRLRRKRRRKEPSDAADASPSEDGPVVETSDDEPESRFEPDDDDDMAPWLEDSDATTTELEEDEELTSEPVTVEPPVDEDAEADVDTEAEEAADEEEEADEDEGEEQDKRGKGKSRRGRRRRGRRSSRHAGTAVDTDDVSAVDRPGIKREMIINTVQREECRIAIMAAGRLEEIYLERAAAENHVGNIYKGIVTNVEPSIQAAFLDFGQGKNGFLHISDLHPQYFPEGEQQTENVGRKMPRRNRPPIQRCLRRGQNLLVQVTKEGIGTKGPTLSTYLSIPGRFLVMMPGMRRLGVSRRIEDDQQRSQLRSLLNELELPDGMGFIARTAALDRTRQELQNDLSYLTRLWRAVEKRIKNDPAPAELYRESDLVIRTIRDVFTSDISRIVVDDPEVADRAREFLSIFSPRSRDIVSTYTDPEPVFHKNGIEAELERLHSRHVPLRSGGSLVIDQTEALVAIDVNSGRFRTEDDAETTAYKINCEAADEIPRQLRLRDLGGVVVCDFIDMRLEKHRRDIERRLIENLKAHKERAKVLRTSAFGLIELTRQRQRASLTRSVYRDCRHCRGTGLVKTTESVTLDVMRLIQLAVTRDHIRMVEVTVAPEVAHLLLNRKRKMIYELEDKHRRIISIRQDPNFSADQVEISCTDARGRVVPHT